MSDSVQPQKRQPTRLPCPRDSPGKNTGVGCHFLLQCIKVKSESEVAQSCPTPSDPMDCSPSGSSVHGICQARVLEWGAIAFSPTIGKSSQIQSSSAIQLIQGVIKKKRCLLFFTYKFRGDLLHRAIVTSAVLTQLTMQKLYQTSYFIIDL